MTPTEKLHAEIDKLNKLKSQNLISEDLFNRGKDQAAAAFDTASQKDQKKSDNNPVSALMAGSEDAQQSILRAMAAGTGNPNKTLENEAKKTSKGLEQANKYLAQLASQNNTGTPMTVVENI